MSPFLFLVLTTVAQAATPTKPVKIHFLEALAPKDTTSSERFQKEYEVALATGKKLVSDRLTKCGYSIEEKVVFYNASDAIEALEQGKKAEQEAAWLLVGPRRSNHYVLLVKGAESIPSVSNMASSEEVSQLGPLHLSISPSNEVMAIAAANDAFKKVRNKKKSTYVNIVSEDCVSCIDFAVHFDKQAKKLGANKTAEIKVAGESPDLSSTIETIKEKKPDVILTPNYSKVSAKVIAALNSSAPNAFFVGGDGWGDSRFGFVQNATDLDGSRGLTVRGFPPADLALAKFELGKTILSKNSPEYQKPGSGSALAILKIIEGTADLLCKHKPKNASEFKTAFLKTGRKAYKSPWGVSVYALKNGDISFEKTVKVQ